MYSEEEKEIIRSKGGNMKGFGGVTRKVISFYKKSRKVQRSANKMISKLSASERKRLVRELRESGGFL